MDVRTFASTEEATKKAMRALADALHAPDMPVLLCASGGSALALLEKTAPFADVENADLSITPLDERYTVAGAHQNTAQLEHAPYVARQIKAGCDYFRPAPAPGESLMQAAHRYETFLREWKKKNANGKIVATLGIGADGHTAGILPFMQRGSFLELFVLTNDWVRGYRHPETANPYPERITPTIPFLLHEVDQIIAYAVSREKCAGAVGQLVQGSDEELHRFPALLLEEHPRAVLFTDCQVQ